MYDQKSEHTNQLDFDSEFSIILLRKLVQKYTASVSFLSGGFKQFYENHPALCMASLLHNRNNSMAVRIDLINQHQQIQAQANIKEFTDNAEESAAAPTVNVKKPRQLKLSYSLSTYGFDVCTSSSGATSLSSPAIAENEQIMNELTNKANSSSSLKSYHSDNNSENSLNITNAAAVSTTTNQIRHPTKILSYLYLGSEEDASCEQTMDALGITCVLNVSVSCQKPKFIKDQNFLRIPVNDGPADKILPFFDIAYKFIEKCRKSNKKVIIHCLAGISRSPTLAIAYLMKHKTVKSDEAYK